MHEYETEEEYVRRRYKEIKLEEMRAVVRRRDEEYLEEYMRKRQEERDRLVKLRRQKITQPAEGIALLVSVPLAIWFAAAWWELNLFLVLGLGVVVLLGGCFVLSRILILVFHWGLCIAEWHAQRKARQKKKMPPQKSDQ